jgi:hypothetical protein
MPRKKLHRHQILRVEERHKEDRTLIRLQEVPLDALRDPRNAPDGTFICYYDELILPKRRHGVKFLTTYTEIFQKEL